MSRRTWVIVTGDKVCGSAKHGQIPKIIKSGSSAQIIRLPDSNLIRYRCVDCADSVAPPNLGEDLRSDADDSIY